MGCPRQISGTVAIFVLLMAQYPVQAQSDSCPNEDELLLNLAECLIKIFPDANHPLYAPIIGGADMNYARDMCSSNDWRDGVNCVIKLLEDCVGEPKISDFMKAVFPPKRISNGVTKFCSRLDEYQKYVGCYFDNREVLNDCFNGADHEWSDYIRNNMDKPTSVWVGNFCRIYGGGLGCQHDSMRQICGRDAGDFLESAESEFSPQSCSAAPSMHVFMATVAAPYAVLKLFLY